MAPTLSDWLALWFGSSSGATDPADLVRPLLTFNQAPDETWQEDHVEVLVIEQQGVWLWGRTADGRYVEKQNDPGVTWRQTGEDSVSFWLHHAAFEATYSMPATRSAQLFDRDTVAALVAGASPLPCREWTWPGTRQRMYVRDSAVVMVCEDGKDFWVVAAAPSEGELAWIDDIGLEWDESDSRRA